MSKPKVNPFENPDQELFLTDVPTDNANHFLLLNKFPVIPNHFILATKANKPQTHMLEEDDLQVAYACLKAWEDGPATGPKRLFAFFNSGEHSGASQPHRHLQFLPVECMRQGEVSSGWDVLIDSILSSEHDSRAPGTLAEHSITIRANFGYRLARRNNPGSYSAI